MALQRLAPASKSRSITFNINERLDPYFVKWFQETKEEGETPAQFVIRNLKQNAMGYFMRPAFRQSVKDADTTRNESITELETDKALLLSEVD